MAYKLKTVTTIDFLGGGNKVREREEEGLCVGGIQDFSSRFWFRSFRPR